jgi:type VI secretion system protein ImpH
MAAEGGEPTADLEGAASAPEEQAANGAVERPGRASGDDAPTDPSPAPPLAGPPSEPEADRVSLTGAARTSPAESTRPEREIAAGRAAVLHRRSLARRLFDESYNFDFFQAVRLLQRLEPGRVRVGRSGPPEAEAVRFRARLSLSFPPSAIYELRRPTSSQPVPVMVQAFMGLTGPSGVLPRHYTELLYKIERDFRTPEKHALRDWFDLFNHRLVSLFYRAWEKYRFYIPFERGEYDGPEPDPFTNCLYSLVGMAPKPLRGRLRVMGRSCVDEYGERHERVLARIEDLVLLHYGGAFGHRPRCAVALEAMLQDYFQVPARIDQFQGQWLPLEPMIRTRLDGVQGNNHLGVSAVAGDRIWDRQCRFRVRLGPLTYARFTELLPDRDPVSERKTFFLMVQLIRLYAEPTLDFDIQLVLKSEEVPACKLPGNGTLGSRLGWNTWLLTCPATVDAEEVVLEGEEVLG